MNRKYSYLQVDGKFDKTDLEFIKASMNKILNSIKLGTPYPIRYKIDNEDLIIEISITSK